MTGPYTFRRFEIQGALDQWDTPPGHWCSWRGLEKTAAGDIPRLFVVLCCPECKQHSTLPHQIFASGGVNPSVVCPHPPCTFHTMPVMLEGWDQGERESQE